MERDRIASLAWQGGGTLSAELPALLARGWPHATAVKTNPKRTVWSLPVSGNLPFARIYLKHDHPQVWRDRLKRLWRCKAEVEHQAGIRLAAAGVPCVPVLGWAQCGRDSFLLSAEIPAARLFWEVWRDCAGHGERRRRFLVSLAAFQRRLLTAGVRHPDLHVGNVLVQEQAQGCAFFLVDLYGVCLASRASALVPRSLLWLTCVLGELTWAEASVFLIGCGVEPGARDGFWRDLWIERAVDTAYRWRSHCRRFSRCSSLCDESVDTHGRWLRLASFPAASAVAAVCAHRAGIASGTGIVKQDRKRCLTRVLAAMGSVIVKQFQAMPGGWPWRPDRLCWLNAHRLASYHIPTATALAWLRGRDRHGYVLFADLGTRTLYDALKAAGTGAERRRLLQDAGALVARLHLVGICHGDLKIHNFMIPSGPAGERQRPCLVDVDRVYFHPLRGTTYRRRNLDQFAETLHQDFPELSPLPFVAAYRRFARLSRAELDGLWRHGPVPARQA